MEDDKKTSSEELDKLFTAIGDSDLDAIKKLYEDSQKQNSDIFGQVHQYQSALDKALYVENVLTKADIKQRAADIIVFIKDHGGKRGYEIESERLRGLGPRGDESIKEFVKRSNPSFIIEPNAPSDALRQQNRALFPTSLGGSTSIAPKDQVTVITIEKGSTKPDSSQLDNSHADHILNKVVILARHELSGQNKTDRSFAIVKDNLNFNPYLQSRFAPAGNTMNDTTNAILHSPGVLEGNVIFTRSLAVPIKSLADRESQYTNGSHQSSFDAAEKMMERLKPVIFNASGNDRDDGDQYQDSSPVIHGPRSVLIGAVTKTTLGNWQAEPYSDARPLLSAPLTTPENGQKVNGTSFTGPYAGTVYAELKEQSMTRRRPLLNGLRRLANLLERPFQGGRFNRNTPEIQQTPIPAQPAPANSIDTAAAYASAIYAELKESSLTKAKNISTSPEELFYIMAASADRTNIKGDFGQGILGFEKNAGGLAFNEFVGAGVVNPYEADKLAKDLEQIKWETGQSSEYKNIEQTIDVSQVTRDNGEYVYKVELSEGVLATNFLGDFRFTFEKGDVSITSPSGTKITPRMATNEKTSVYEFMGETFDKGQIVEVRTTQPLEAGSDINIRGVNTDSPLIQLRKQVIDEQLKEEAMAKKLTKADGALHRLAAQAYLHPQNSSDNHISSNDMNVQLNAALYQNNPQGAQNITRIAQQARDALDVNQDGRAAIEEIQEAVKRSGVKIDNITKMTELLNAGNNASLPQVTPSGSKLQGQNKF